MKSSKNAHFIFQLFIFLFVTVAIIVGVATTLAYILITHISGGIFYTLRDFNSALQPLR